MPYSISETTRRLLRTYGILPRKRLGQNFLVDPQLAEEILAIATISPRESVIEIGGGLGSLTRLLAERARRVSVVEVDPKLVNVLHNELKDLQNTEIIEADILEIDLPRVDLVVSNVPYQISSPLLIKLLQTPSWERAILTLQDEFAVRLTAKPGTKDYGRLTLAAYYYAEVKLHGKYPPESFFPPPEVSSRVVALTRRRTPPFHVEVPETYWELSRRLFTQRNRLLTRALKTLAKAGATPGTWSQVLLVEAPKRLLGLRVRELSPTDLGVLAGLLSSRAEAVSGKGPE